MEYLIHHARHVPFSSQVMVDEDEVMDLVDQLRFNLPDEIKQANWTVQEQQRIISEAHAEAYALEQLVQLEQHLSRTLATVKRGVEALQSSNTEPEAAASPEPEEAAR